MLNDLLGSLAPTSTHRSEQEIRMRQNGHLNHPKMKSHLTIGARRWCRATVARRARPQIAKLYNK